MGYFCSMTDILIKIIPVVLLFALGYILKLLKIIKAEYADFLLRIVFYVCLPSLIIHTVGKSNLNLQYALLPLSAALIIICTFLFTLILLPFLKMDKKSKGVFLIGTMILNCGFLIPFVYAVYGEEGLTALLIFDLANAFIVYTFIYYLACRYADHQPEGKRIGKKLINSPPVWSLFIALFISIMNISLPVPVDSFLKITGDTTIPLLLIALGAFFDPRIIHFKEMTMVLFIRFGGGLLLGLFFSFLFRLEGLYRIIVILGAAAPVGFNTLTFASLEKLDIKFAASLVSFGIIIGIFLIPFLMWLFG